jgi:hypothetical protein
MLTKEEKNARMRERYKNDPEKYQEAKKNRASYKATLRTHCFHGHALVDGNVYEYTSRQGHNIRECKTCAKQRNDRRALQLRENHLNRKFNLSVDEFNSKLKKQGGKCYVCSTPQPGGMGNFHVDHDHDTGEVRKLLCVNCNRCLGAARDSPKLLDALALYLREHGKV